MLWVLGVVDLEPLDIDRCREIIRIGQSDQQVTTIIGLPNSYGPFHFGTNFEALSFLTCPAAFRIMSPVKKV